MGDFELKACPACGGKISERAAACPHCGHPYKPDGVVIRRVEITTGEFVGLFVKMGVAAVPAAILVSLIWAIGSVALAGIFGGIGAGVGP